MRCSAPKAERSELGINATAPQTFAPHHAAFLISLSLITTQRFGVRSLTRVSTYITHASAGSPDAPDASRRRKEQQDGRSSSDGLLFDGELRRGGRVVGPHEVRAQDIPLVHGALAPRHAHQPLVAADQGLPAVPLVRDRYVRHCGGRGFAGGSEGDGCVDHHAAAGHKEGA